jgi:hypothetical protein
MYSQLSPVDVLRTLMAVHLSITAVASVIVYHWHNANVSFAFTRMM